jgi:hypothetical protein
MEENRVRSTVFHKDTQRNILADTNKLKMSPCVCLCGWVSGRRKNGMSHKEKKETNSYCKKFPFISRDFTSWAKLKRKFQSLLRHPAAFPYQVAGSRKQANSTIY